MAFVHQITPILERIKVQIGDGLPINGFDNSDVPGELPETSLIKGIQAGNVKLKDFIEEFLLYGEFLDDKDLENLFHIISSISNNINSLLHTPFTDRENRKKYSQLILNEIDKLPSVKSSFFYNTGHISRISLSNLFNLVNTRFEVFFDLNFSEILNNATLDEVDQIINILISLQNESSDSPYLAKDILRASKLFQKIIERTYKLSTIESVEELKEKAVEIKENVGLFSNSNLIDVFKNEASSNNIKILIYNIAIFAIFTTSLISLIFLIFLAIFGNVFKDPISFHFYGFYISFFLFLSGLLAYLIKERKRLLNHKHYCTITYLELSALPMYTLQLNDKNKQDDLIIHLGERYFKGPNLSGSNDDISTNITTSKLSEVIKLAQEVKSTLK